MTTSSMTTKLAAAALLALCASACVPDSGPLMRPGSDCLECHGDGGGDGEDGPRWTLAGTVYGSPLDSGKGLRGVAIEITAADGRTLTLHSNQAGNFYLADGLAFPLHVAVTRNGQTVAMQAAVNSGSCNRCHYPGSTAPAGPNTVAGSVWSH
jgi:hypothetical protein